METSEQRFRRIAEYRVKKVLNDVRILGNCANRRAYSYTDAQIQRIFDTIQRQLDITRAKFTPDRDIDFKL